MERGRDRFEERLEAELARALDPVVLSRTAPPRPRFLRTPWLRPAPRWAGFRLASGAGAAVGTKLVTGFAAAAFAVGATGTVISHSLNPADWGSALHQAATECSNHGDCVEAVTTEVRNGPSPVAPAPAATAPAGTEPTHRDSPAPRGRSTGHPSERPSEHPSERPTGHPTPHATEHESGKPGTRPSATGNPSPGAEPNDASATRSSMEAESTPAKAGKPAQPPGHRISRQSSETPT